MVFLSLRLRSYAAARAMAFGDQERSRKAIAEAVSISHDLTASKLLSWDTYRYPCDRARLDP